MKHILLFSAGQMMYIAEKDARKLKALIRNAQTEGGHELASGSVIVRSSIAGVFNEDELVGDNPVDTKAVEKPNPPTKAKK